MKLVREEQFHKKDNLLDLAGYTRIMYDIKKKKEAQWCTKVIIY